MSAVALVTGGNRGIGLATALRLREDGFTVVVGSRSGEAPEGLDAVRMDVSLPESIEAAYAEIEERFGPVAVLVANAGITRDTLLMRMSDDDIDVVLQTNLAGSIRLARRAHEGHDPREVRPRHLRRLGGLGPGLGGPGELRGGEGRPRRRGPVAGPRGGVARASRVNVIAPGIRRDRHDGRARRRAAVRDPRRHPARSVCSAGRDRRCRRPSWPRRRTSPGRSSPSMAASEWGTDEADEGIAWDCSTASASSSRGC